MGQYFDISVPSGRQTTVYPGDPAPSLDWRYGSHEKGDAANIGFLQTGLHHGTHVDAPWHFVRNGRKLGEVPLEHWVGPCFVADLCAEEKCIGRAALERAGIPEGTRRLLLKTRNSQRDYWHEPWNPNFIYLHRDAAAWCVEHELLTIGIDYLTIDPPSEPLFPAHHVLLGNNVTIIEYLNLRDVLPGTYELIAAPINLPEAEAAGCRALLYRP